MPRSAGSASPPRRRAAGQADSPQGRSVLPGARKGDPSMRGAGDGPALLLAASAGVIVRSGAAWHCDAAPPRPRWPGWVRVADKGRASQLSVGEVLEGAEIAASEEPARPRLLPRVQRSTRSGAALASPPSCPVRATGCRLRRFRLTGVAIQHAPGARPERVTASPGRRRRNRRARALPLLLVHPRGRRTPTLDLGSTPTSRNAFPFQSVVHSPAHGCGTLMLRRPAAASLRSRLPRTSRTAVEATISIGPDVGEAAGPSTCASAGIGRRLGLFGLDRVGQVRSLPVRMTEMPEPLEVAESRPLAG